MRDNQLIALVVSILRDGLANPDIEVVASNADDVGNNVLQAYQPTNQGVPTGPAVFLYKLADRRYGWTERADRLNEEETEFRHTESQWMDTAFQISALAIQDPSNINAMTASDLANASAAIMNSDTTLQRLHDEGVGILRITNVRNTPFEDDKGRFEYNPSFDFTLTHQQVIITSVPVITDIEVNINRV